MNKKNLMRGFTVLFVVVLCVGCFSCCSEDNEEDYRLVSLSATGYADGYEYVDMGLSVKWATCNVGAKHPYEYGDYFSWGETAPKNDYSWATYKFTSDGGSTFIKYSGGEKLVLDAEDDAAAANWGGEWRMPTLAEIKELLSPQG